MQQPRPEDTNEPEVAEIAGIETLKQALAEEKTKAEEYLAGWQRAQADFANYKRRIEQDKEEMSKFANTTLILSILPVLDDLERALTSIPPRSAKRGWVEGIELIWRKLQATLEAQGVSQIKALGEPFDPNLHEAARQGKGEEGIVVEEIQKGYRLHDRVIRPSKVVVGGGEEAEKKED
jgi:molecular chaperone GrpE